jgi:hypothetical protein
MDNDNNHLEIDFWRPGAVFCSLLSALCSPPSLLFALCYWASWEAWGLTILIQGITWKLIFGCQELPSLLSALRSLLSALCCWEARQAWEPILLIG